MRITRREAERDDWILQKLTNRMRQFGKMYPNAGYGGMFRQWLVSDVARASGTADFICVVTFSGR